MFLLLLLLLLLGFAFSLVMTESVHLVSQRRAHDSKLRLHLARPHSRYQASPKRAATRPCSFPATSCIWEDEYTSYMYIQYPPATHACHHTVTRRKTRAHNICEHFENERDFVTPYESYRKRELFDKPLELATWLPRHPALISPSYSSFRPSSSCWELQIHDFLPSFARPPL